MSKFATEGAKVYNERDRKWTTMKKTRYHFYLFVEYLLQKTTFVVGDLKQDVKTFADCHCNSLAYGMLGYVYFCIFEYVYSNGVTFACHDGRIAVQNKFAKLQYFVSIANAEYNELCKKDKENTATHWEHRQEDLVRFYS